MSNKRQAPWNDYKGNEIFEGDTIVHPSGETGVIAYRQNSISISDNWLVDYGDGVLSRLCLQIGDKGMAVKQGGRISVKMAKPSKDDIAAAEDLMSLLNIVDSESCFYDGYPDLFDLFDKDEIDFDNTAHLISLLNKLNELVSYNSNFHCRVISGMCHVIMYDKNEIIDPDSDVIELHPRFKEMFDELQRETRNARYWNKRYHEVVEKYNKLGAEYSAFIFHHHGK